MRILLGIMLFGLAACSGNTSYPKAEAGRTDRLMPINIVPASGTCLWEFSVRREEPAEPEAPIFGFSADKAFVVLNGTRDQLSRQSSSRELVAGLPREQTFTSPSVTAQLIMRLPADREPGVLHGVLSLTRPSGWSTVLPLVGAKSCR